MATIAASTPRRRRVVAVEDGEAPARTSGALIAGMFIDELADSRREHRVIPYRVADDALRAPCAPRSLLRTSPPARSDGRNQENRAIDRKEFDFCLFWSTVLGYCGGDEMPEVLITGGGGLVGLNTARALAMEGVPVVITARQRDDRIDRAVDDFRDLITIEPIDLARGSEVFDLFSRYRFRGVIHAAQAHQRAQTRAANRANYDMAFNCLEAAEASGVNRFLLVSSIIVYAGLGAPLSEDKRFPVQVAVDESPDALFSLPGPEGGRQLLAPTFEVTVKRALEGIALDYATPMQMGGSAKVRAGQKFNENRLDVAVLRISTEFGPGYTHMGSPLSRAVHTVAGKGDLMSGNGYMGMPLPDLWNLIAMSPLTYVRDTANALVRMMQIEPLPHRVYNLSSGFTTSPREQLQALNRIRPDAAARLKIDPNALREEPYPTHGFSADRLTEDTGWSPGYAFEEALEDYIAWLQQHPW